LTGLPVEQILQFGQLGQGAQQVNNQSSSAISDAMYKQALESYYGKQAQNEAERIKVLNNYNGQKIMLEQQSQRLKALGMLKEAEKIDAEVAKINQFMSSYDRGTTPEQQNARLRGDELRERTAHNRNLEILGSREASVKEANSDLQRLRDELAETDSELERDKIRSQIKVNETKVLESLAETTTAIAESDNLIDAQGNINLYSNFQAPDSYTDLYYYTEDGFNGGRPTKIPIKDPKNGTTRYITIGEIRKIAAQNPGYTPNDVILHMLQQIEEAKFKTAGATGLDAGF
jgi:hypothetical protein